MTLADELMASSMVLMRRLPVGARRVVLRDPDDERKRVEDRGNVARAQKRRWYLANRERHIAMVRERRLANPEKARAARKKWRRNNPEKARLQARKWARATYQARREKLLQKSREYYAKNREKRLVYMREYARLNRDRINERVRAKRAAKS